MSKIKKNFSLENLEVVDISTEGKAIAKHEGMVVFIENAVPGDVVDVTVHRKKTASQKPPLKSSLNFPTEE